MFRVWLGLLVLVAVGCSIERAGQASRPDARIDATRPDGGSADGGLPAEDGGRPPPPDGGPPPVLDAGGCAAAMCTPGAMETESAACGSCGPGRQSRSRLCLDTCDWSPWSEYGPCEGDAGECAPGAVETSSRTCGMCGGGTQAEARTCQSDCRWGAWADDGACTGEVTCSYSGSRYCPGPYSDGWWCCSDGEWRNGGC